jgi:hypothetical protein
VLFGSTPGTVLSVNGTGTLVTVTSPAHATGTVDVTVSAAGGSSAIGTTDRFTYLGPVITSLTHASGPATGGGTVKIAGTDLNGATSVTFGTAAATIVTVNRPGTLVTVDVPAGVTGAVTVTLVTPAGSTAAGPADQYTYLGPSVTAIHPTSGPPAGGTKVTIVGTDLNGATAVHFGTTTVTTLTVNASGTRVVVHAPAGTAGPVDVTVTTPGGTSAPVTADRFTYS